jgi:glyoxylate carboligase
MDYVKVAEGFGCAGERVFDPAELPAAFKRALESKVPYVVDIVCEPTADCSMAATSNTSGIPVNPADTRKCLTCVSRSGVLRFCPVRNLG